MKQELAGLLAAYLAMQLVTWWLVGQLSQAGGLGFPALIALCQNLCTTVFLGPVMVVSWDPVEDHAARRWWRELTLIGLAGTLTVFLQSCTPTDFTVAPEYQMARQATRPTVRICCTAIPFHGCHGLLIPTTSQEPLASFPSCVRL